MTDHTNITSPSLTSGTVLFFGIPLEFFQTTNTFKKLLEDLEKVKGVLADSDIEATPKFKAALAQIRVAWQKQKAADAKRVQEEALAAEKQQLAVAVLDSKASYFELLPEDQERIFEIATELSLTDGHELQKGASKFLINLQRQATMQGLDNQEKILERQEHASHALNSLQETALMMKVEALVKRRISQNLSVILAEAEEAYASPHNNVEEKGLFGGTKVVGKVRTREYFCDITKARYEALYRGEIENELLGRVPQTEAFFSGIANIANDETTLLESIAPRQEYKPTLSRFAQ
jgi:hypothetical protein